MESTHVDVLIIGAGLSGIGAGYHLKTSCPNKSFVILEGRERLGGTWDLFKYPGIRSDSDMYTLGYPFRPWSNAHAIADGSTILEYIRETAEEHGIDKKIRFGVRVERASWSSAESLWTVEARDIATGATLRFTCGFLFACAGYYDYDSGYTPDFKGIERFKGRVVHPQQWTSDVDYEGKRVVVIGSGATAVTLVPELAKKAAHVTMLQRSPSYILSAPAKDPIANWLRTRMQPASAYKITRWKNVLIGTALYAFCQRFPERASKGIIGLADKQMRGAVDVKKHFTPTYKPWDQRLCLVPDGDLFKTLRSGKASVVTDHIERFTETGIELRSGATLDADLVVTATGLKLKFLGGVALEVDGKPVDLPSTMAYKGLMCSDVPNMALAIGYTNASWTLKSDLTCQYVCRLLNFMEARGYKRCVPRQRDKNLRDEPLLGLSSGYVQRAMEHLPRQGSIAPWKVYQNYPMDLMAFRRDPIDDGVVEFS